MMRYLLILSWLELGGSERQAINLAKHLIERGNDAVIMGICPPGKVNEVCEREGITCVSFPPRNSAYSIGYKILDHLGVIHLTGEETALLGLIRDLAKHIKKRKYDVCISYCTTANIVLGQVKLRYGAPVCIWRQGDAGIYDRLEGLQPESIKVVDGIICNGITSYEWVRNAYGRDARIIYNGVGKRSVITKRAEWRKKMAVSEDDLVFAMVANYTTAKDHSFLLEVWSELKNIGRQYKLVCCGAVGYASSTYESLNEYVSDNDLKDSIRLLGQTDDVYGLYEASDCCIFAAKKEGSPNGVIEGCMCGLPVIANNLPEIREIVSDRNLTYLYKSGDVRSAVECICHLADTTGAIRQIGDGNRSKVHKLFDPHKNYDEMIEYAESLCMELP